MPHKYYHGKTGVVYNVTRRAVGVIINKRVRHRIIRKHILVRIEHVKHSKCREDFLKRRAENDARRAAAKTSKKRLCLKRQPKQPEDGHFVSTVDNQPQRIYALPYAGLE
jgi:large subunit ribosomal protein L21e